MTKKITKRLISGTLCLPILLTLNSCEKKYKINSDGIFSTTSNYIIDDNNITTEYSSNITIDYDDLDTYSNTEAFSNEESITMHEETTVKVETTENDFDHDDIIIYSDPNFRVSYNLSKSISEVVNNFGKNNISFQVYDLETQNTFSYNLNSTYNGACIVKPSVVIYLCKLAELGLINLNDTIKYEGNVVSGSGYLNGYYNGYQASTGQKFTMLELMYHTLYYSDNNAYRLLHHYLVDSEYYDDYCSYMNQINAESLKVNDDIIWVREAKVDDGVNIMRGLYDFYNESVNTFDVSQVFVDGNSLKDISQKSELTFGEIPYYIMANGKYDYIENQTGNFSITKTGFVSGCGNLSCRNLVSISYGKRTFFICVLTKFNSEDLRKSTVNSILNLLNNVVNEYDDYCNTSNKEYIKIP